MVGSTDADPDVRRFPAVLSLAFWLSKNEAGRHRMEDDLATKVEAEIAVISKARNILHAHNRPYQPLPNDRRIAARGYLEGAMRRLWEALAAESVK